MNKKTSFVDKRCISAALLLLAIIATALLVSCTKAQVNPEKTEEQITEENIVILKEYLPTLEDDIIESVVSVANRCEIGSIVEVEVIAESDNGYVVTVTNEQGKDFYMVVDKYGVALVREDDANGTILWGTTDRVE
jgi:hypothetical protein